MSQRYNENNAGLGESLREKVDDARTNVKELGRMARDVASETFENLRENAGEYLDKGRTLAKDFEGQFIRQIRTYPIRSLAIAAGVGLIFGVLMRRGKSA